ncbi:phosphohistidine phosphatase [Williamsia phyllosphaerae]|uniref:Phosphohistidine phosphatase n=2 Tax=Williamsia phyllosphaerae TaxID=885042 RepID=A0ABQ1UX62_9NOCA|nr:phosphohistidine phosphatase [Williamsia phyllosphaerae]
MAMTNSLLADRPLRTPSGAARPLITGPTYSLHLTADPRDISAAQRLRFAVFSREPGFASAMADVTDGRDADRFDDFCDHLIVRHNDTDEVVGCYRMLPPTGAIAAGGLYTATEFDLAELDPIAPQTVEMGRACVAVEHRSGSVMALMWSGILRYLDDTGHRYAVGCTSVPIDNGDGTAPGAHIRGVRDLVRDRHRAPWEVHPRTPVEIDGRGLDDIAPPSRLTLPPLLRGYVRIGAQICGEPAHDVVFGVADFVTIIDKQNANIRYLDRLRAAADAAEA